MKDWTEVANEDVQELIRKDKEYGASWKKRGGVGAFMMLARKWDRLELQVQAHGYDVFKAAEADKRAEGLLDDIGDLRRYLLLVETEILQRREADEKAQAVVAAKTGQVVYSGEGAAGGGGRGDGMNNPRGFDPEGESRPERVLPPRLFR